MLCEKRVQRLANEIVAQPLETLSGREPRRKKCLREVRRAEDCGDRGSENAEVLACNRPQRTNEELSGLVRRDGSNTGEVCIEEERRDTSTKPVKGEFRIQQGHRLVDVPPHDRTQRAGVGGVENCGCLSRGTRSSIARRPATRGSGDVRIPEKRRRTWTSCVNRASEINSDAVDERA